MSQNNIASDVASNVDLGARCSTTVRTPHQTRKNASTQNTTEKEEGNEILVSRLS